VLSRATISASGSVAGAGISRTGGPAATAAPKPLECTGEAAATMPIARPSGGGPPAASARAYPGRTSEATKSAYSPRVCTKTPRRPELPPEARHTY
jgi:hypothetical protein